MSQDTPSSGGLNVPPVAPGSSANSDETLERVFLVSYPNIIFMYPTVLASLFCSIFMWFKGDLPPEAIEPGDDVEQLGRLIRRRHLGTHPNAP